MSRRFRFSRGDVIASLQRQQGLTQGQLNVIASTVAKGQWEQWIEVPSLAFIAPWGNYDALHAVRYRKNSAGMVQWQGLILATPYTNGASTQAIFMLPPGYRPASGKRLIFPCLSFETNYQTARIDVDNNTVNSLIFMGGGRQLVSLNNIYYIAEA